MKLNHIKCEKTKPTNKTQKLSDGGGLYLLIKPKGGKYWRMKYYFLGKEKLLSLGVFPTVSLADAREKRDAAKKLLDQGIDPNEKKKIDKLEKRVDYENNFENLAREWHKHSIHTWKPDHAVSGGTV